MADAVIRQACPRHRFLGVAELPNHRLAFTRRSIRTGTGVSDIVPSLGESVWGVLYEIDEDGLRALDRKEGGGWAYRQTPVLVRLEGDADESPAVAYSVIEKEPSEVPPTTAYLDGLIRAACDRGLPGHYVRTLESRRSWAAAAVGAQPG